MRCIGGPLDGKDYAVPSLRPGQIFQVDELITRKTTPRPSGDVPVAVDITRHTYKVEKVSFAKSADHIPRHWLILIPHEWGMDDVFDYLLK